MSNDERLPYYPDSWIIIKLTHPNTGKIHFHVLGGWDGGYLKGSSWRLNSGITNVKKNKLKRTYTFSGHTGSEYICHKKGYGMRMSMQEGLLTVQKLYGEENIEILDEKTKWNKMDWVIDV